MIRRPLVTSRRAPTAVLGVTVVAAILFAAIGRERADAAVGPDVTVLTFSDGVHCYGSSGGFVGYSVGTRSCNRGDLPLNWCSPSTSSHCAAGAGTEDHPVIAQNMYRLKNNRFEQIGMSWLKHGFLSTNSTTAGCAGASGQGCQPSTPEGSAVLRVGCTDPYGTSLNGGQPLGRRSEVNGTTGIFPMPPSSPGGPYTVYDERIKVATTDVDPTQNPGALYWAEAQYIASDDAAAGNGLNNASYQQISPILTTGTVPTAGSFVQMRSAIEAWRTQDPSVLLASADVSGPIVERFQVARKVTDLGGGFWHYEYAVRNHNSDRSARGFNVQFPLPTSFTNVGFKDIEAHSGEPFATTDWSVSTTGDTVSWFTDTFATDPNANALRFASMFNFWFDADQPPWPETGPPVESIDLFKPGSPTGPLPVTGFADILKDGFEGGNTNAWSGHT
jgi:hypothetical protein